MNLPFTRRRLALLTVGLAVLGACLAVVIFVFDKPGAQPVSVEPAYETEASLPQPPPTPAQVTAEEQARADLEQLVREYYAAENAVFLNPMSDPSAALDPYLRNPASAARIADILSFRNAGHTLESSTAEVHWVTVTAIDLAASPAAATLVECRTLEAGGADGRTGHSADFTDRGLVSWTATTLKDGSWRLSTYEDGGTC